MALNLLALSKDQTGALSLLALSKDQTVAPSLLEFSKDRDAPNPGGPLTTRQSSEYQ